MKTIRRVYKDKVKELTDSTGLTKKQVKKIVSNSLSAVESPIELDEDEKKIVSELNAGDIDFINNMPLFVKFGKITVLHAGVQNYFNLESLSKKEESKVLRLRYITNSGKFIPFGDKDGDSIFWSDVYDGKQGFIVYGHQQFNEVSESKNSLGIDTGCVYGNKLSSAVFSDLNNIESYSIYSIDSNRYC